MNAKKSYEWNILNRRTEAFMLWAATDLDYAPVLVLGELKTSESPVRFVELVRQALEPVDKIEETHLWELKVGKVRTKSGTELPSATSPEGKICHYWFEVRNRALRSPDDRDATVVTDEPILVTDPLATAVDYRLRPFRDEINQPASVIKIKSSKLVPCDPSGRELQDIGDFSIDNIPKNNELVIYELPTSWTRAASGDIWGKHSVDYGSFRHTLDLLSKTESQSKPETTDFTFSNLGVNAIELLPPTDAKTRGEWGYAPAHYFAPDYDLGGSEHNASTDLAELAKYCLEHKIRLISDTVMAFGHDPYIYIAFNAFHIRPNHDKNKKHWNHNADAFQSDRNGELRDAYGGSSWRYNRTVKTYDPKHGGTHKSTPARMFHRAHLAWWMSKFLLGGFRLDSINNIGNYDFVREFSNDAHEHFRQLYDTDDSKDRFIVIGEELAMPIGMVQGSNKCVDALWNERFQENLRAAIVGQGNNDKMEWTVIKMIDCTKLQFWKDEKEINLDSGTQVVNYITSHDTEGDRKERLWNYLDDWGITQNADKAQRCKLAFACLLTSLGIPMIFAGEEFCEEGDNKFKHPYKQQDPVNWIRRDDIWRQGLFECVARLVELRKRHPALINLDKGSVDFIHQDHTHGREVFAWVRTPRGEEKWNKVVVVANFSDQSTGDGKYKINGWEKLQRDGKAWRDVIVGTVSSKAGEEALVPWDVKVYEMV